MKALKLSVIAGAVLLSTSAMAQSALVDGTRNLIKTASNPAAVSLEVGTLGYGANIAWSANDKTEVVAGWTGGSFDTSVSIGGNDSIINWKKVLGDEYADYQGNLKVAADFSNPYVGVKVRPFANRLTVGTGVIFQDNSLDVTLNSQQGKISVNGNAYEVNGDINVHAESKNRVAPYLTVGFKPNSDRRFGMFGELGAVYTGEWKTNVTVPGEVVTGGTQAQLEAELEDKIASNNPEWYPIVKLGATYRF